jgi:hypothetical protein
MIRAGCSRQIGHSVALALLVAAACTRREGPQVPTPRAVDTAGLDAASVPAAVLDECHRPLRGRMDRVAAELQLPAGTVWRVFAALPDALRAVGPAGTFLVRDGAVWLLGASDAPTVAEPLAAELRALLPLLDAAAFGPLHRAHSCQRQGAGFVLRDAAGTATALQLRAGTLLPEQFGSGDDAVRCVEYLRTSSTWMVARAASARLGTVAVTFEQADLDWREDFFAPPPAAAAAATATATASGAAVPTTPPDRPEQVKIAQGGGEQRPAAPQLADLRAHGRVLLADPGDWPGRAAAYLPVHRELERQEQQIFGFPMLLELEGAPILAVPFRPRRPDRVLRPPSGWRVAEVAAGRQLLVFPPSGDFAARRAAGEQLLRAALTAQGLTAAGPVVCQPYVHLEDELPSAELLAAPVLRLSVPVR